MPDKDKKVVFETDVKLNFTTCSICKGHGIVEKNKCTKCQGKGVGYVLFSDFIFWDKNISKTLIIQKKVQRKIKSMIDLILYGIGILGILFLLWFLIERIITYFEGSDGLIEVLKKPSWKALIFWLTAFLDLYLVYRKILTKTEKERVKTKGYNLKPITDFIPDFDNLKKMDAENKINIAQAFTAGAEEIVEHAYLLARKFGHYKVINLHLLAALFDSSRVRLIFGRLGIEGKKLVKYIGRKLASIPKDKSSESIFTDSFKKVVISAYVEAYNAHQNEVDVDELLIALVREDHEIAEIFYELEIDFVKIMMIGKERGLLVWDSHLKGHLLTKDGMKLPKVKCILSKIAGETDLDFE